MPATFDYCLKNGFLGVGWRVPNFANTKNWSEYQEAAQNHHDSFQGSSYINRLVKAGDLVWTRDTLGQYYLAQVTSAWEYWSCQEADEKDIDIANIFRCTIRPVEIDSVPGKVVASFRARRTIQEVASASALEYSKYLWNQLSGASAYQVDAEICRDIFMLLDDKETEDAVFLYLQTQGWLILPNSRQSDTLAFEYLLVQPTTGEIAAVQVKTGNSGLDAGWYAQYQHKVFLFQSNEIYGNGSPTNVVRIMPKDLHDFLREAQAWLPGNLRKKLQLSEVFGRSS